MSIVELRTCGDAALLAECRCETFRASGPGGQKRNKTSSAVRLTHEPSGISAIANESRSQAQNRRAALRRLRHRLVLELRESVDVAGFALPAGFGGLAVSRRADDYLPTMGVVLDVLAAARWSVSGAAALLGASTSKLVAVLQGDEKLLAKVNEMRVGAGLKPLGA